MISVGNETWSDRIFIFPNPVDNVLCILTNGAVPLQFVLYDVLGKELVRNSTDGLKAGIDMFVYQPGMYYLHLANDALDQTFKVFRKNA